MVVRQKNTSYVDIKWWQNDIKDDIKWLWDKNNTSYVDSNKEAKLDVDP